MNKSLAIVIVVLLSLQSICLIAGVFCRKPGVDEAWIAEWSFFEASEGRARSELFRGYCLYGERVILIHRLFVLLASGVIRIAGFHLHWLRLMVLFMSAVLVFLVWRYLRRVQSDRGIPLAGIAMLLLFPLFFRAAGFFRPEIMYTLFGFGSFMFIGHRQGDCLRQTLAGLLAGLAMITHITGSSFIVAGAVLIIWERRPRDLVPYLAGAALAVVPWVVEILLHYDVFLIQVRGELVTAKTSFTPISPLLNLLQEHKRLFRNPEAIVATTLILASLISTTRESFRRHADLYRYFTVIAVTLGMTVSTKTVTYTVPLLPFGSVCFGLALADWRSGKALKRWGRTRRGALAVTAFLTVVVGLRSSIGTVTGGYYSPEDVNLQAGELIPDGARCLAPLHFIFGQVQRLRIGSLYLARVLYPEGSEMSIGYLLEYARYRNTVYVVLDRYWMKHIEGCSEFLDDAPGYVRVTDTGELVVLELPSPER